MGASIRPCPPSNEFFMHIPENSLRLYEFDKRFEVIFCYLTYLVFYVFQIISLHCVGAVAGG